MNKTLYRPFLAAHQKIRPLAATLVKAAAEQGATLEELEIAADMALNAYRDAMDRSAVPLAEFESEAKAALDSI